MNRDALIEQARSVACEFAIDGKLEHVERIKTGHINDTFVSEWSSARTEHAHGKTRYIHQRMNPDVFKDVAGVLRNVQRVTEYLRGHLKVASTDAGSIERTLELVPTRSDALWCIDDAGFYWRTFIFVENSEGFEVSPSLLHAQATGEAFGRFLRLLTGLDQASLIEPIANFQNVPGRFDHLEAALTADPLGRAKEVAPLVEFVHSQRDLIAIVERGVHAGTIPLRVTHSDPKINNILFERGSTRVLCLVDLDTCMSGTSLYDFGDLVRSAGVLVEEDEQDLSRAKVDVALFRAITAGYLKEAGAILTSREVELFALSPGIIGMSLGMRFLADHILGDQYFRIHRPGQNLDRARTQFAIVRSVLADRETLDAVVQESLKECHQGLCKS